MLCGLQIFKVRISYFFNYTLVLSNVDWALLKIASKKLVYFIEILFFIGEIKLK